MTSFEKKQVLIARDPLTKRLDELIAKGDINPECPGGNLLSYHGSIENKWRVGIQLAVEDGKICGWHFFWFGEEYPSIFDGHQPVIDARKINMIGNKPARSGRVLFGPHELPIIIDLSTLTQNDAAKVKKEVWEITKKALTEFHSEKKKGWQPSPPADEPEELGFLYHCKDETFANYLRWYDLKTEHGLTFRLIAIIEKGTTPEKQLETTKETVEKVRICIFLNFKYRQIKWLQSPK